MARRDGDATGCLHASPGPVQLRHECPLSGEAYVARSAWRDATSPAVPAIPGGCGLVRHGTYPRRTPTGMRTARYYCPTAHETFSLLADLYRSTVEELASALQREDTRLQASETLRGLIDSIVLTPEDGQLRIELRDI